jgi:hypothetical protein
MGAQGLGDRGEGVGRLLGPSGGQQGRAEAAVTEELDGVVDRDAATEQQRPLDPPDDHVGEAGGLEDLGDTTGVGELEGAQDLEHRRVRGRDVRQRRHRRDQHPLVDAGVLPAHETQATTRAQRTSEVRERRDRIGEEHHPEAADHQIQLVLTEPVALRVGRNERDVAQARRRRAAAGRLQHRDRQVDAHDPARRACRPRRGERQVTGAATHVEDPLPGLDLHGIQDVDAEGPEHRLVAPVVGRPVVPFGPVPMLGLQGVRGCGSHRSSVIYS